MSESSKKNRFIRALLRQEVDSTPVWVMRQAGRYLPEYRALRAKAGDFMSLCKNPEWACEVTLQPLDRFDLDAAILFSDILTIPDAMGLGLFFAEGEGPKFKHPIRSITDINRLSVPDPEDDLAYVMNAVRTIRKALNGSVPLIGFSGSPWTLATYMVEGGSTKNFSRIKGLMYSNPQALHALLTVLSDAVTAYLNAQIRAGAQVVQIFDSWGGVLSPETYRQFSMQYLEKIVSGLIKESEGEKVPCILFSKGCNHALSDLSQMDCDALGVDWSIDIADAFAQVNGRVALQGNLDPAVLYASEEVIEQEVIKVMDGAKGHHGHVFNLGHGIHQHVEPSKLATMIECVRRYA